VTIPLKLGEDLALPVEVLFSFGYVPLGLREMIQDKGSVHGHKTRTARLPFRRPSLAKR